MAEEPSHVKQLSLIHVCKIGGISLFGSFAGGGGGRGGDKQQAHGLILFPSCLRNMHGILGQFFTPAPPPPQPKEIVLHRMQKSMRQRSQLDNAFIDVCYSHFWVKIVM